MQSPHKQVPGNRRDRRRRRRLVQGSDAGSDEDPFQRALLEHQAGRLESAQQAYAAVPLAHPQGLKALRRGAEVALRRDDAGGAIGALEQLVGLSAAEARDYYNLGIARRMAEDLIGARDAFQRAVALDPVDAAARGNLAGVLLALDEAAPALSVLDRTLEQGRDLPPRSEARIQANRAIALRQLGRLEEAAAALRRVLTLEGDDPQAAAALGAVLRDLGWYAEAVEHFRRIVQFRPHSDRAKVDLASALVANGDMDEVIDVVEKLDNLSPEDAEALSNLGNAFYDQGRPDLAATAFRGAVELVPDFGAAWDNLGLALQVAGDPDGALEAHRRAVKLLPEDAGSRFNLGTAAQGLGRHGDAEAAYRECLRWDPDHDGARHMLAALEGRTPETAPAVYVEHLFDAYARWFDKHLVDGLGYRTPDNMRNVLDRLAAPEEVPRRFARALDLGCGTGLSGVRVPGHRRHPRRRGSLPAHGGRGPVERLLRRSQDR